ncbi:MAG: arylamine N-acetyltransferase [Gammaproteobacteria bacterium]
MKLLETYKKTIHLSADFSINTIDDIALIAQKHFQKYPFTTLSIHLNHSITLTPEALLTRLMEQGYGLCYHHNAAFYLLLNALNVPTVFIATRVRKPGQHDQFFSRESHIGLLISFEGKSYLFDPGFGGTCHYPIPLEDTADKDCWYKVKPYDQQGYWGTFLERRQGHYIPLYDFKRDASLLHTWADAYAYVAAPEYPFWTAMLYSQTAANGNIYYLVSIVDNTNTLFVFSPQGEVLKKITSKEPIFSLLENNLCIPQSIKSAIAQETFANENMGHWLRRQEKIQQNAAELLTQKTNEETTLKHAAPTPY